MLNHAISEPGAQKHNKKTGLASVALVTLMALGSAACGPKGSAEPAVSFDSYPTAQAKLADLVEAHGGEYGVDKTVSKDIKQSLEATVPLFKQHISETLGELIDKSEAKGGLIYTVPDPDGRQRDYDVSTFIDDDGNRVDSITTNLGTNNPDNYEHLFVTYDDKKGDFSISYTESINNGGATTFDDLDVEGKHIQAFSEYDEDGNLQTHKDTHKNLTEFTTGFGPWSEGGFDLKHVYDNMQQVEDLLNRTNAAIDSNQ